MFRVSQGAPAHAQRTSGGCRVEPSLCTKQRYIRAAHEADARLLPVHTTIRHQTDVVMLMTYRMCVGVIRRVGDCGNNGSKPHQEDVLSARTAGLLPHPTRCLLHFRCLQFVPIELNAANSQHCPHQGRVEHGQVVGEGWVASYLCPQPGLVLLERQWIACTSRHYWRVAIDAAGTAESSRYWRHRCHRSGRQHGNRRRTIARVG
jgi:hypothetical protein